MFGLGITDLRWHAQLLADPPPGVVNFWTPTPWKVQLQPGARWFFMLKAPTRRIGGYGSLSAYEEMAVSEAWARFGRANGVRSEADLRDRVVSYARKRSTVLPPADPIIGCVLLKDSMFLPDALQISPDALGISFPREIVKWKRFEGELQLPFEAELPDARTPFELVPPAGAETELRRAKRRVGQQQFRNLVLGAYADTCAFTGTRCREALEAAHIQPFVSLSSNHIQNGLALRRDIHALFDAGLLAVAPDGRIVVSASLAGTDYAHLAGREPQLPAHMAEHPSALALAHHHDVFFRDALTTG